MSRVLERFSGFEDWQQRRVAREDELREEFQAEALLSQTSDTVVRPRRRPGHSAGAVLRATR